MRTRRSRISSVVFGGLAIVVAMAGLAWACIPNADFTMSPAEGPAGAQTTIRLSNFSAQPVEVRWNAVDGPVLATVTPDGGSSTVQVTIPQVEPGSYFIYTVGSTGSQQRPFEVLGPAGAATTPKTAGSTPGPSGAPIEKGAGNVSKAPRQVRGIPVTGHAHARPGRGDGLLRRAGRPTPIELADSRVTRAPGGQRVFTGSVAAPTRTGNADRPASRRGSAGSQHAEASRHAGSDSRRLPSLTTPATSLRPRPDRRLGIGIALLAVGILAPLVGFLVADARRRRAESRR